MRMITLMLALAAAPMLSGCALTMAGQSWSVKLAEKDAANAAQTISALVADRVAPAGKPITLASRSMNSAGGLEKRLEAELVSRGYTIAPPETKDAIQLRYVITDYQGGLVLRVTIDNIEASTVLVRGQNGELAAAAPLAVREDRR